MKNLTATIKTKSNYRNLNGQTLEVVEIVGIRVTCKVKDGHDTILSDFIMREVTLNY